MAKLTDYIVAARPWSFSMSLISISVGTLLAAENGPIYWNWFILVAVGIVLFHAAANILNDYYDARYQVDHADSPTANYRPQPILTGLFTFRQLLIESVVLFALACAIGLILAFQRSRWILAIGLLGFLGSVFYTAGPIKYKYRALGEIAVFLIWGPLMIEGAYVVQRQVLSLKALFVSIPFGIWVALVLLANNMRDIEYDSRLDVKTLGIILGDRNSLLVYSCLMLTSYLCVIGMILTDVLSPWGLLILLSLLKAVGLLKSFRKEIPEMADAATAQLGTIFGLLLVISMILNRAVTP